ncbi:MAG: cysteine desulfurase [Alphaproteobacteria bacterium]|nr:cysteine desulfurase [Alphaproteobacteria bacterium]
MFAPAYLDHNATTPLDADVLEAMLPFLRERCGNASSRHEYGRAARAAIDTAREQVAAAVGAHPTEVVFTSGGSEANNLFIKGAAACLKPATVAVSAIEHPCVREPAADLKRLGWDMVEIAVDAAGRVVAADFAVALARPAKLVSVMLANNETGVIQPVAEAAAIAHAAGALLHCDAVQGLGKLPVDLAALGADLLTVSAHKIGGPAGVGALVLRPGLELAANRAAGGQEQGRRPGTENLAGIAGFGAALDHLAAMLADAERQRALRQRLEAAVRSEARVFGEQAPRLANTVCLAMPGVPAETQVMAFDLAGFCVSAGSACSSGKVQASPVLAAMGVAPDLAASAIRVSFGTETTADEIDAFARAWKQLFARKRAA